MSNSGNMKGAQERVQYEVRGAHGGFRVGTMVADADVGNLDDDSYYIRFRRLPAAPPERKMGPLNAHDQSAVDAGCNCGRNMPYLDWSHVNSCPLYREMKAILPPVAANKAEAGEPHESVRQWIVTATTPAQEYLRVIDAELRCLDVYGAQIEVEELLIARTLEPINQEMLEALEAALPRLAHDVACLKLNPAEMWLQGEQYDDSGCTCAISKVKAAIKSATGGTK